MMNRFFFCRSPYCFLDGFFSNTFRHFLPLKFLALLVDTRLSRQK